MALRRKDELAEGCYVLEYGSACTSQETSSLINQLGTTTADPHSAPPSCRLQRCGAPGVMPTPPVSCRRPQCHADEGRHPRLGFVVQARAWVPGMHRHDGAGTGEESII